MAAGHSSTQAHGIIGDLANSGADLEATDREGRTPLLFALEGSRKDAIDALLRAGALPGLYCVCRLPPQQAHLLIAMPGAVLDAINHTGRTSNAVCTRVQLQ